MTNVNRTIRFRNYLGWHRFHRSCRDPVRHRRETIASLLDTTNLFFLNWILHLLSTKNERNTVNESFSLVHWLINWDPVEKTISNPLLETMISIIFLLIGWMSTFSFLSSIFPNDDDDDDDCRLVCVCVCVSHSKRKWQHSSTLSFSLVVFAWEMDIAFKSHPLRTIFSFSHSAHPLLRIDLFLTSPYPSGCYCCCSWVMSIIVVHRRNGERERTEEERKKERPVVVVYRFCDTEADLE